MGVFVGLGYYVRGMFFLLTRPGLWAYIIMPVLISAGVLSGILWAGWYGYQTYFQPWLVGAVPIAFWQKTVTFVGGVIATVFGVIFFYLFANLLSGPFNEMLSAKVEKIVTGHVVERKIGFLKAILRFISGTAKSLYDTTVITVLLLLMNCIPGIGQIGSVIVGSYRAAAAYLGYVFDRREMSYDARKKVLSANLGRVIGFGFACFFLLLIPIVNFFVIPVNVVGGTLLALHIEQQTPEKTQ